VKGRMAMKKCGYGKGITKRDSDFHTQCRLARPVEKTWSEAAFGEKLSADSELLFIITYRDG
jgi:hypothetical protein